LPKIVNVEFEIPVNAVFCWYAVERSTLCLYSYDTSTIQIEYTSVAELSRLNVG